MSLSARWLAALALGAALTGCHGDRAPAPPDASLRFVRDGQPVKTLDRASLEKAAGVVTVQEFDPYYNRPKRYRALPMRAVLAAGFGKVDEQAHYVLRARDGYTIPIAGARLLEQDGSAIAIEDLDTPGWQPIGPQQVNPGPFYVIWRLPGQQDSETHPRPWQLASIEIASFESVFPHTSPGRDAPDTTRHGYDLFRESCVRCHAINREGGKVGPELNVPQSIVEYRPVDQIKAYIRNPLTFRYGAMPPHPQLSDRDLDDLVAYFRAMSTRKFDPAGAGAPSASTPSGVAPSASAPPGSSAPRGAAAGAASGSSSAARGVAP